MAASAVPTWGGSSATSYSVRRRLVRSSGGGRAVELVAADFIAPQARILVQGFQLAHHVAAVAGADGHHQLLERFRAVVERSPQRAEPLAGIAWRLRHRLLEPVAGSERPGQVEADLGADMLAA